MKNWNCSFYQSVIIKNNAHSPYTNLGNGFLARIHFYHLYSHSTRDIFTSLLRSFSSVLIIFVIIGFTFAYMPLKYVVQKRVTLQGCMASESFKIDFYASIVWSLVFQWFLFWSTYSFFTFSFLLHLMIHLLLFSHFRFIFIYFDHWYMIFFRSWWSFCIRSSFLFSFFATPS